ncbi:hypothetical protein J7M28_01520 [bacterium]|nr:hypothetical protein [bacterium]
MPTITKKSIEKLREKIASAQVTGKDFVLSSGAKGKDYLDMKGVCLDSESLYTIAATFIKWMKDMGVSTVGGSALGADPIVGAIVAISTLKPFEHPVNGFIIRKVLGESGTDKIIEGDIKRGTEAVMVEDVLSAGGSTLRATRMAQNCGIKIREVFVVVDKMRGGARKLIDAGYSCRSIFTLSSLKQPE